MTCILFYTAIANKTQRLFFLNQAKHGNIDQGVKPNNSTLVIILTQPLGFFPSVRQANPRWFN